MTTRGDGTGGAARAGFATTRWSLVLRAGTGDAVGSSALEELCEAYWYAVYAFLRRRGVSADEAPDIAQGFFALFLEREDIRRADPTRGRFRSFLLSAVENFLSNERRRAAALKRGGGRRPVSLDRLASEQRFQFADASADPRRAFERDWAEALLARVLERLGAEYAARGEPELFEGLRKGLAGEADRTSYRELSERTGRSAGALRVAAHRLRQRYGEVLRLEVAETLTDPAEIEDELRALARALAN